MSTRSETVKGAPNRLMRAWLAVAAVLVAAILALVVWASFGTETTTGGGGSTTVDQKTYGKMYPDGRFGQPPIQIGDYVCQQCQ